MLILNAVKKTRGCCTLVTAALACAMLLGCSGAAPSVPKPENRVACTLPFATRSEMIDFFVDTPMDPRDEVATRQQIEAMYPQAAYDAVIDGSGGCQRWVAESEQTRGYTLVPQHDPHRRWPVVLFLRGGLDPKDRIRAGEVIQLMRLAQLGYYVVAPEYQFDDRPDEVGGAENERVEAMLDEVLADPRADPRQVFIYGVSRGGINAFQIARHRSDVRAVFCLSCEVDMTHVLEERPEMADFLSVVIPGFTTDRERALALRSPSLWASELHMPILFVHGRRDWRANPQHVQDFAAPKKSVKLYDGEHFLWGFRAEILADTDQFFRTATSNDGPPRPP